MQLSHITLRDDSLTHQVRFSFSYNRKVVSCNCRGTVGRHSKAGKIYYEPIDVITDLNSARALYNDPENHYAPFGEEDKAKW